MKSLSKIFVWLGILLLTAAAGLGGYNLWDTQRAEKASQSVIEAMQSAAVLEKENDTGTEKSTGREPDEVPLYLLNPQIAMPTVEIDGNAYIGVLEIPVLSLTLPVMNEWSYPNLKIAPCLYSGSAYLNNMVIAAHNYRGHFATLKNLQYGDEVRFTDTDGNEFLYTVEEIEVLQPTDVEQMTESDWDLTLFTCTVGAQSRVTVRCSLVED